MTTMNCQECPTEEAPLELVEYVHKPGGQHFSVWECRKCKRRERKEDTL